LEEKDSKKRRGRKGSKLILFYFLNLILISKRFSKFPNIVVIFLIQNKKRDGGFIIKPYK
jgi:hypothetical protein